MKTLLATSLAGLISLSAFAQEKMVRTDMNAVRNVGMSGASSSRKPLIQTDLDRVFATGSGSQQQLNFELNDGHYILGLDRTSHETHSLFINKSVSDPQKYIALKINNDAFKNDYGTAQIMIGAVINSGAELQFSPTSIDVNGNLVVAAEGSRSARVLRISLKPDWKTSRFPYKVRGLNNATDGQLLGMRGAKSNVNLKQRPARSIFEWKNSNEKIDITGDSFSRHTPRLGDETFQMLNLNGDLGGFVGLVRTTEDTMTTDSASDVKYEKLVVFLSEKNGEDCLLIANPVVNSEELAIKLYSPTRKGFFEKYFNGRLSPKQTNTNPFN
jgi:hypothetical protein